MKFRKIIEIETRVEGVKKTEGSVSDEKSEPEVPGIDFMQALSPHIGKFVRIIIEVEEILMLEKKPIKES